MDASLRTAIGHPCATPGLTEGGQAVEARATKASLKPPLEELDDLAALRTDEVEVVLMAEDVFVVEPSTLEVDRLDEPTVAEQGERAVDGRRRDVVPLLPEHRPQFISGEMLVGGEDSVDDLPALFRELELLGLQVPRDGVEFGFHGRSIDKGRIETLQLVGHGET